MKKYVVGFISFHDNELTLETVYAETPIEAQQRVLLKKIGEESFDDDEYDLGVDLKQLAFNMDTMISDAMEIKE